MPPKVKFQPHDFFRKKATAIKEKLRLRKRGYYARVQKLKATKRYPSGYQVYLGHFSSGRSHLLPRRRR